MAAKPKGRAERLRCMQEAANAAGRERNADCSATCSANRTALPGFDVAARQRLLPLVQSLPNDTLEVARTVPRAEKCCLQQQQQRQQRQSYCRLNTPTKAAVAALPVSASRDPYAFPSDDDNDDSGSRARARSARRVPFTNLGRRSRSPLHPTRELSPVKPFGSSGGSGGGGSGVLQISPYSTPPPARDPLPDWILGNSLPRRSSSQFVLGRSFGHQPRQLVDGGRAATATDAAAASAAVVAAAAPSGLINAGNSCYSNAVLQVLLAVPYFEHDLRATELDDLPLPSDGVTRALQACAVRRADTRAEAARGGPLRALSAASLLSAMAAISARWGAARQEDAHEFYAALLDALQREVVAAQLQQQGRRCLGDHSTDRRSGMSGGNSGGSVPRLRVSAAACPGVRSFSGSLTLTVRCSCCGHTSTSKEQFNHISLELPQRPRQQQQQQPMSGPVAGGDSSSIMEPAPPPSVGQLLAAHFAPERLAKACEACGRADAPHTLTRAVRRLPRILVVHLKRFVWQQLPGGGAVCRKLGLRVLPEAVLQLGDIVAPGRPVPQLLADLMQPGLLRRAARAAEQPEQQQQHQERQQQPQQQPQQASTAAVVHHARPRPHAPVQRQQLIQPWRSSSSGGGGGGRSAAPRLARMITASEQHHHHHQKQQQQQQQQQQQLSCRNAPPPGSPSSQGAGHLCSRTCPQVSAQCVAGGSPPQPRRPTAATVCSAAAMQPTVSLAEEDELQRALALSLLDCGGTTASGGGRGVEACGEDDDPELLRALQESAALHEAAQVAAQQQNQQQQQQQVEKQQQNECEQQQLQQQQLQDGPPQCMQEAALSSWDRQLQRRVDADDAPATAPRRVPHLPLVEVVEDSDCSDSDRGGGDAHRGAPDTKVLVCSSTSNVDPVAPGTLGKENACIGSAGAAAAAADGGQKRRRKPLGQLLAQSSSAKLANAAAGSAAAGGEPGSKRPALGSAAPTSLGGAQTSAAAQLAGAWPATAASRYALCGVVRHVGPLASSGHFVADVLLNSAAGSAPAGRDRRGRWFHYDDEYVAPLAGRPALGGAEGDGYLLLYANTALDGPWSDDDAGHGS